MTCHYSLREGNLTFIFTWVLSFDDQLGLLLIFYFRREGEYEQEEEGGIAEGAEKEAMQLRKGARSGERGGSQRLLI